MSRRTSRLAAAALVALTACRGHEAPPGPPRGLARDAAVDGAEPARAPWRCAVAEEPAAPDEEFTVGGRRWRLAGRVLMLAGDASAAAGTVARDGAPGAADEVTIAAIADAAGSAPATIAALGRLRSQFGEADLVISLGGMGTTPQELGPVLAALAERAPWPVVAMPGDLEAVPAQAEAIAAVRRRGGVVIDGRQVQRIELPGLTIGLVPGAGAAERLVAGAAGCRYERAGVAAVLAELASRPGLRVLATAESPRSGTDTPTGEPAITARPDVIDLALHGGSDAATAARGGHRDGSATPVSPGSSDALPRRPDARRRPTAGLLRVRGTAWRWQPIVDPH